MIEYRHSSEACTIANEFVNTGYLIKPRLGSAISAAVKLLDCSYTQNDNDSESCSIESDIVKISSIRNDHGVNEHDVITENSVKEISGVIANILNAVRNQALPLIEEISERIDEQVNFSLQSLVALPNIKQVTFDGLFKNPTVVEQINRFAETTRKEHPVIVNFPELTVERLREILNTGAVRLDAEVNEFFDDNVLICAYEYFFSDRKVGDKLSIGGPRELDSKLLLAGFLIATRLIDDLIDEFNGYSLADYRAACANVIEQAGLNCYLQLRAIKRAEDTGLVILGAYGGENTITVLESNYLKFTQDGGCPEVLFAVYRNLVDPVNKNISGLSEIAETAIRAWKSSRLMDKHRVEIESLSKLSTAAKKVISQVLVEKNTNKELLGVVESYHPVANEIVERLRSANCNSSNQYATELVCSLFYKNTQVPAVIALMDKVAQSNANLSMGEVATLAIIEFVSDYVSNMLVVEKDNAYNA